MRHKSRLEIVSCFMGLLSKRIHERSDFSCGVLAAMGSTSSPHPKFVR
jgi:hypothetical protein